MVSPTSSNSSYNVSQTSHPVSDDEYDLELSASCFFCKVYKKVKKERPGEPTKAFKKAFGAKDGDLVRTKPIRYNPETKKMEVGHNGGAGVVWKPISDEE